MSPAQAACMAAEARRRQQKLRLRGQHCCKPCTITIPDSDDEDEPVTAENVTDGKPAAKKRHATTNTNSTKNEPSTKAPAKGDDERKKKTKTVPSSKSQEATAIIDLTEDDDAVIDTKGWACKQCTYINLTMALACSMCSMQKA